MRTLLLCVTTLGLFLLQSCSLRSIAISEVSDMVEAGIPAFESESDLELVKDALPANIKLLEAMLESAPENQKLLALLAQMYGSYAFGFIDPLLDSPAQAENEVLRRRVSHLFQKGAKYAEKALQLSKKSCLETLKVATEADKCFQALDREQVTALYWFGFNLAAYINRNLDNVGALGQGVFVEKSMQRVLALQEDYMYGGAHLLLMAYFGSRPAMMGGSLEKAKSHYQAIKKLHAGKFKLADVYYARYVLVQQNNKAEFEKLLQAVLEASPTESSAFRLYDEIAKSRAQTYLKNRDELF